ncbi:MAG: polysaccharide pyruvyl transferase family protein [Thermosynechococcaceae cyanobacterium]
MKILITNTVALNVGDAAILLSLIKILKISFGDEISITIYDSQADIAKKYYPDLEFRQLIYFQTLNTIKIKRPYQIIRFINRLRIQVGSWLWFHSHQWFAEIALTEKELITLKDYNSADLIISTGGTYLVENYFLAPRILDYKISIWANKPLIFFTQSMGPFKKASNQRLFKYIFNYSSLILLRDNQSFQNLNKIEVTKKQIHVMPDSAFLFANNYIECLNHKDFNNISDIKIAISVRSWSHFKNIDPKIGQQKYIDSLRELIIHLVDKYKATITFISTCQGIPEYHLDDSKTALEITKNLPERIIEHVTVDKDFHTPEQIVEILKDYDIVIATRMHMAILALSSGTPVLPIAYEFKTTELFKKLKMEEWTIDIEEIRSELLIPKLDNFIENLSNISENILPALKQEYSQLLEIKEILRNNKSSAK